MLIRKGTATATGGKWVQGSKKWESSSPAGRRWEVRPGHESRGERSGWAPDGSDTELVEFAVKDSGKNGDDGQDLGFGPKPLGAICGEGSPNL